MAITPQDIEEQTFSPSKHGYDTEEVDNFLEQLSGEVDAMIKKIADLKGRLNTTEQQLAASQAQVASLEQQLQEMPAVSAETVQAPAPVVVPQPVSSGLNASEEQISRVLIVAQQSADKLVDDARANAERIRNEADQKAREVIRQALAERENARAESHRRKQSREEVRSEYKKLLQHFIDDADSVFPQQTLPTTTPTGSVARSVAGTSRPVSTPQSAPAADFGDLD